MGDLSAGKKALLTNELFVEIVISVFRQERRHNLRFLQPLWFLVCARLHRRCINDYLDYIERSAPGRGTWRDNAVQFWDIVITVTTS